MLKQRNKPRKLESFEALDSSCTCERFSVPTRATEGCLYGKSRSPTGVYRSGFVYRVINNPLNTRSCSGFSLTSSDLVLMVQFTFFHLMLQSRNSSLCLHWLLVTVNILHAQILQLFISLITRHLFLNIEKDVTADFMLLGTGLNSHWFHRSACNNPVLNHPFTSFVENMEGLQVPHEVVTCHLKNKHQVGHDVLAVWGKVQECFTFHCSVCRTS